MCTQVACAQCLNTRLSKLHVGIATFLRVVRSSTRTREACHLPHDMIDQTTDRVVAIRCSHIALPLTGHRRADMLLARLTRSRQAREKREEAESMPLKMAVFPICIAMPMWKSTTRLRLQNDGMVIRHCAAKRRTRRPYLVERSAWRCGGGTMRTPCHCPVVS